MKKSVLAVIGLFTTQAAFAWDGITTSTISQIDTTDGPAIAFRIYFGSNPICGSEYNWAYLNTTDPNYSVYVATVLMAKATSSTVIVYSNRDSNGYCHMHYITVAS